MLSVHVLFIAIYYRSQKENNLEFTKFVKFFMNVSKWITVNCKNSSTYLNCLWSYLQKKLFFVKLWRAVTKMKTFYVSNFFSTTYHLFSWIYVDRCHFSYGTSCMRFEDDFHNTKYLFLFSQGECFPLSTIPETDPLNKKCMDVYMNLRKPFAILQPIWIFNSF